MLEGRTDDPRFASAFLNVYLAEYTKSPVTGLPCAGADWHPEFCHDILGGLGKGQAYAAMAARGQAKSVLASLLLPLACLALKLADYTWVISDSATQAKLLLAAIVQKLDEADGLLLHDFPHLARQYDSRGRPVADRDDSVVLRSGARIEAIGAHQKLRGRRQSAHRPSLIVADDIESEASVATRAQIDKLDSWFSSAILGATAPNATIVVVGTALHSDSLLSRLQKRDGWIGKRFPAVSDATDLSTGTWKAAWPEERLVEARKRQGARAFAKEMLLNPLSADTQLFPREHYRYRPTRDRLLESAPGELTARVRVAVDPAVGEKLQNDYTAIAVTAQLGSSSDHDILEVHLFRASGRKIADRVAAEYERWKRWNPVVIVEVVQSQAWLAQMLKEMGIPVTEIRPQRDKIIRAEPVAALFEQGAVWMSPHLKGGDFEEQLETFPSGVHDDGVDAVVYAITDAATRKPTPRVTLLGAPGWRARLERQIADENRLRGEQ